LAQVSEMKALFKHKIYHPFFLAAYPVLALLAHNIEEIKFSTGLRALAASIVAAVIIFAVLKLLLKNWYSAGLVCSLAVALFFSYGHLYNYLEQTSIFGMFLGRHRYLVPLWAALLILGFVLAVRKNEGQPNITGSLNIIAGFLLIIPVFQLVVFATQVVPVLSQEQQPDTDISELHLIEGQDPPDVYYIILDSYTRGDVFQEIFEFDNARFLDDLRALGFYVASCSQSNYSQTRLSLAASLNMKYLDEYLTDIGTHSEEMARILPLARHSSVRQALEGLGYTTVSFETGHLPTQWEDTDYYLSSKAGLFSEAQNLGRLNEFEVMLLQTSAGLLLTDATTGLPQIFGNVSHSYWETYRDRILYTLDRLEDVPAMRGPKFVFAHILAPHPPYVFGPNGEFVKEEKGKILGYRDQVAYVNQRMIPLLQAIIANSATPPIIILQGDHGPDSFSPSDRMAILNAYYLPNAGEQFLYEKMSPVNSFRVVLNTYFGGNYGLLEDISRYTLSREPYQFEVIPNEDQNCSDF